MRSLLLALVLLSFNAFSATPQLIKIFDGTLATCSSFDDTLRYQNSGVMALSLEKMLNKADTVELKVRVSFYSCQRTNGEFGFKKLVDPNFIRYPFGDRQITVERKDFTLRAINGDHVILDHDLVQADRDGFVELTVNKRDVTRTTSGKAFIDFDLTGLSRNSDNLGHMTDFEQITFGTFRLFL